MESVLMLLNREAKSRRTGRWWLAAMIAAVAMFVPSFATAAVAAVESGDSVWIGKRVGPSGLGMYPVYLTTPADPANPGEPDYWAYCIEHDVKSKPDRVGQVGDDSDFSGSNYYYTDPTVPGKVRWILAHSYPALSLEDFAAATNVPGLTEHEAITATQTAIWAYTDMAAVPHDWSSWYDTYPYVKNEHWQRNSDAYEYLIAGVTSSGGGVTPEDLAVSVSITGPAAPQEAQSLVGPFVVQTNQPTASVTVDPNYPLVDVDGQPVDAGSVVDGQSLYLDMRDTDDPGMATVSASVKGASGSGLVLNVPLAAGETYPDDEYDHWQTLGLVAASTARTTAQASVRWAGTEAPALGTTLTDLADGDHTLPWNGGVVVDTIIATGLTPGVQYEVYGELMRKSDGTGTGIIGSAQFTPSASTATVQVNFTVPEGYAGEYLVAFEALFETYGESEEPLAVHQDINDAAQTVLVEKAPVTTTTPTNPQAPAKLANTGFQPSGYAAAAVVLLMLGGASLALARSRRSA